MTPRRRAFELGAALATAAAHLVTNELGGHGVFVVAAVVGWTAYCVVAARRSPPLLTAWGLTRAGTKATWRATRVPAALVLVACVAWGAFHERWPPPAHALVLVALYPLWGVVQQLLVQGFVVRHIDDLLAHRHRALTVVLGAAAFGMVHLPHLELVVATCAFGAFATPVWLRHRNLWPLGLWHGVLGVVYYYFVLGRDPWLENFGG